LPKHKRLFVALGNNLFTHDVPDQRLHDFLLGATNFLACEAEKKTG
jgi:hypothetical protein